MSLLSACLQYTEARCRRYANCGLYPYDTCEVLRYYCPDRMFSPGTVHTPDELVACARDGWPDFPCESLAANVLPSCAPTGTRAVGERCAYGSQCASRSCLGGENRCSTCAARGKLGESCSAAACMAGLRCVDDRCTDVIGSVLDRQLAFEGEPCTFYCDDGLVCASDATSSTGKRCRRGSASLACKESRECPEGYRCKCGEASCPYAGQTVGSCVEKPHAGADCTSTGESVRCGLDSYCDTPTGKCLARIADGGRCSLNEQCLPGSTCGNDVTCRPLRAEGEPCTSADRCISGASCVQGSCVARAPALFEELCGP